MSTVTSVLDTKDQTSIGDFATPEDAQHYIDTTLRLIDAEAVEAGRYTLAAAPPRVGASITISLEIENTYENHPEVTTYIVNAVIAAPPQRDSDEYEVWCQTQIIDWSGAGYRDGDSWYDITVTACSDEKLIGTHFDWGY